MKPVWTIQLTAAAVTFLDELVTPYPSRIRAMLQAVELYGPAHGLVAHRSKPLGGGLFEFKLADLRLFYGYSTLRQREVVIVGGMIKKRGNIPAKTLALMRARLTGI